MTALLFSAMAVTLSAEVNLVSMAGRDVIKLLADPNRSLVYALNRGGPGTNASLVAFNPVSGAVERELTLPATPTDMDLSVAEDTIYVIHSGIDQINRIDLKTFQVDASRNFPPPGNWVGPAEVWYDIRAGRPGVVYYVDAQWAPVIHAIDFATGQELGAYDLEGGGVGGLTVSRSGEVMFAWAQYGWSAGVLTTWISRLDVGGSTFLRLQDTVTWPRRDPLDTPLLLTTGEDRVFLKQYSFDASDLDRLRVTFPEDIYAISSEGDLAVGTDHVFNGHTGEALYTLPFTTTVSAFAPDQQTLLLYNRASAQLALVPTTLIAALPVWTSQPTPPDGAVVGATLAELRWTVNPAVIRHEVYWGTEADAVLAAEPGSTVHLATTVAGGVSLSPPLIPKTRYYWRVDAVTALSTHRGVVWHLDVASASAQPASLREIVLVGYDLGPRSLAVEALAGTAWTVNESSAWFEVTPRSGVGAATLTLTFQTAGLALGRHQDHLTVHADGVSLEVPVSVEVIALEITRLIADRERPYLYAFQAPPPGQSGWSLLVIQAGTSTLERVLPIGFNPTDMTIHYGEGRLYIADWGYPLTQVMDLTTWQWLPPLELGTDVYKINAGRPGRIYVEGFDQWVQSAIIDTATGLAVGQVSWILREGDAEISPDGTRYYHADNNISNASLHLFDISTDEPVWIAATAEHPMGSRNLILSGDGSRVFWRAHVFNAQLDQLWNLGAEIYACSANGRLALSSTTAYDTETRQPNFTLPFATTVLAVSEPAGLLYAFDLVRKQLESIPLAVITNQPPSAPNQVVTTAENVPVSFALLATDPENDPLTFRFLSQPGWGALSGDPPLLVYTPQPNFFGVDAFQYVAMDAHRTSAVGLVTIQVTPVNDPPVARDQSVLVPVDGSRDLLLLGDDPEGDPLTFQLETLPRHGSLLGTPPVLTYTPAAGFQGTDSFTFTVADGEFRSAPAQVTLTVAAPRCAPILPSLVAWWPGEDQVYDSAGGLDSLPGPELAFAPGKVGRAFVGHGRAHLVRVPASAHGQVASNPGGWTLEAWVAPAPGAQRQVLLAWAEAGLAPWMEWALVPAEADPVRFRLEGSMRDAQGRVAAVVSDAVIEAGRFQHVALAFDPGFRSATLFRNAVPIAQTHWDALVPVGRGDLFLGGLPGPTRVEALDGLLDEVAIHDHPLTAADLGAVLEADAIGRCAEPRPPRFLQQPLSATVEAGATVTLSVEASGAGPLRFQWFHNGELLEGGTNRWLTVANLTTAQAGDYTAMVRNDFGLITSQPAAIRVSLLVNGSFETGTFEGWTMHDVGQALLPFAVRTAGQHGLIGFFRTQPTEGVYSAVHGWDGGQIGTLRLGRTVQLPAHGATLSFDYRGGWNLRDYGVALYPRQFRVVIAPADTGVPLASYLVLRADPGTVLLDTGQRTAWLDLGAFSGDAIRITLEWTIAESYTGPALFELDNVRLVPGPAPAPRVRPGDLNLSGSGALQIEFDAAMGRTYTVLASTDLQTWSSLGSAMDLGSGRFRYLDSEGVTRPMRFYRLESE